MHRQYFFKKRQKKREHLTTNSDAPFYCSTIMSNGLVPPVHNIVSSVKLKFLSDRTSNTFPLNLKKNSPGILHQSSIYPTFYNRLSLNPPSSFLKISSELSYKSQCQSANPMNSKTNCTVTCTPYTSQLLRFCYR